MANLSTVRQKSSDAGYYLGAAAVILAIMAAIVVAYPRLPPFIPLHWDAHGQVNGWGPKWSLFLYGPGMMAGIVLLFAILPWLSPKPFSVESFRGTYNYIMLLVALLFGWIHVSLLIGFVWPAPRQCAR